MVIELRTIDVIDSFERVAKVTFSKESIEKWKQKASILSGGDAKSMMFQQRYYMILQQLFRDSKFVDTARGKRGADFPMISFGADRAADSKSNQTTEVNGHSLFLIHETGGENSWRFEITPVESLPGSVGVKVVFGMLTKGEDGKLVVEDIHQSVPIKLDAVQSTDDYITENIFVLLKGEMVDDNFVVSEMTLPPIPQRSLCESSMNLFGGPFELTEELVSTTLGHSPEDSSIAVLANVVIDSTRTLERLHAMFSGFEECDAVPAIFVLCGDFCSRAFNPHNGDTLRNFQKSFESFSQLLARHPATLEKSKIVIVPGPNDPGSGILPQPPFTDSLVRGLSARFPNVILASNPCRIRFYDKQIVVFTGNTVEHIRKNRLVASSSITLDDEGLKLTRCLLSQMHLVPGTVHQQNVVWEHDAGMKLYPPPHALFLHEPSAGPFIKDHYGETIVVGMPTFSTNDERESEFHLYSPFSNESTLSSL